SMEAMESEGIIDNARRIGDDVLRPSIEALATKHPVIGDVRGTGVFFALELVTNRATRAPLAPYGASSTAMNELVAACRRESLLVFNNFNRIHVVPPCTITPDEARDGLERLDRAFESIASYYEG
ncbi:MAG TPA: aminotransferase class III-fold pyridoxal phosphate-dependent enzyme, partial [Acidimicrobiales bacterium]